MCSTGWETASGFARKSTTAGVGCINDGHMSNLGKHKRVFDIELTNRCNALCTFCPRDETPQQGFMAFDTWSQALTRAEELETMPDIYSTGQGEPLLHPQLLDFVHHARERNLPYGMTTNAALLTAELAEELMDTGLRRINLSVSDMGDDYEEVYALNFDQTRKNIMDFLELNEARGKPVETMVNIVKHDLNAGKIGKYRQFWLDAGVDSFLFFKQNNRGGACDHGLHFIDSDRFRSEAEDILQANDISPICSIPYLFVFVGWNGQYYICCNDYRKTTPLGTVFDHGIEEMDHIKKRAYCSEAGIEACNQCDMDPVNKVREKLFELSAGEADAADLEAVLEKMREDQAKIPPFSYTP